MHVCFGVPSASVISYFIHVIMMNGCHTDTHTHTPGTENSPAQLRYVVQSIIRWQALRGRTNNTRILRLRIKRVLRVSFIGLQTITRFVAVSKACWIAQPENNDSDLSENASIHIPHTHTHS